MEQELDPQLASEPTGNAPKRPNRHVGDPAILDQRDEVLADCGNLSQIALPPAQPMSERSEPPSQRHVIHARRMTAPPYAGLTARNGEDATHVCRTNGVSD